MQSRLLDMRDCRDGAFAAIHRDMLELDLSQQPRWFRPLLKKSGALQRFTGYDHWSRAWEYPWAVLAADMGPRALAALDVGGGGSPFALYLAARGHDTHVADPSLDQGTSFVFDRQKSLYRNVRSLAKRLIFRAAGIHSLWGLPGKDDRRPVRFHACPADRLDFPDRRFDRVFCLSVMEHIPGACLQVPANRYGSSRFTTPQLKTIQEVITLVVFCVFSVLYLREDLKWNYLVGFALMILAVFVIFKKW